MASRQQEPNQPEKMKIRTAPSDFNIKFPGGGSGSISVSEIYTIDIETLPTMSVDVDFVTIGYENGEFIEVSDDADGFKDFCEELSKSLMIEPPIHFRLPVSTETGIQRVYERS
jgi:hypothetical protein